MKMKIVAIVLLAMLFTGHGNLTARQYPDEALRIKPKNTQSENALRFWRGVLKKYDDRYSKELSFYHDLIDLLDELQVENGKLKDAVIEMSGAYTITPYLVNETTYHYDIELESTTQVLDVVEIVDEMLLLRKLGTKTYKYWKGKTPLKIAFGGLFFTYIDDLLQNGVIGAWTKITGLKATNLSDEELNAYSSDWGSAVNETLQAIGGVTKQIEKTEKEAAKIKKRLSNARRNLLSWVRNDSNLSKNNKGLIILAIKIGFRKP
jgi:hypothetical protein